MSAKSSKNKKGTRIQIWLFAILAVAFLSVAALIAIDFIDQKKSQKAQEAPKATPETETKKDTGPAIYEWSLSVPKIGVSVPVIANVDGTQKQAYNQALAGGVAHFSGTALPGAKGNVFIFGHSSSILGTGKYDKVFARLGELSSGSEITTVFNGVTYKYVVTEKKITSANDTSVLAQAQSEQLTLMTCWPVGSDAKRLVIKARATSP